MTKTIHLIGCASGIAGADAHSGEGPTQLANSDYLAAARPEGVDYQWDEMFQAVERPGLRKQESLAQLFTELAKKTSAFSRQQKDFMVIGGDHSCAIGTWSGIYDAWRDKGDIGLIWIDAHMDSHTPETSPSMNIHGMPLACLLGFGYPELTGVLHPAPKFKPENVCLIGVRSYESGEAALLKRLNVRIYFMEEVREKGFLNVLQEAVAHVSKNTVGYGVTLDMDALDPEDAPGVDVPEEGGIHRADILSGFKAIAGDPKLVASELVEFDPTRDQQDKTERLLAELVAALAGGKK